jgi:hypothetical protein
MNRLSLLIFLTLATLLLGISMLHAQSTQDVDSTSWLNAERALKDYLKSRDLDSRYVEYKSAFLRSQLPDLRIFVINKRLLLLNQQGKIFDLDVPEWRGDSSGHFFIYPKMTEFLKCRGIKIDSASDAIRLTDLVDALSSAPTHIYMLSTNTKGFTVFDEDFLKWFFSSKETNWKDKAEQNSKGWTVTTEYVGPPSQIMEQPTYCIQVDANRKFLDIKQLDIWKNVPDSNDVNIDSFYVSYDTIAGIVKLSGILLNRYSKERLRDFPIVIGIENISGKKYSYNRIDSTRTDHNGRFCISSEIQNAKHLVFRYGIGYYVSYGKLDDIISALREKRVAPNQALPEGIPLGQADGMSVVR